MKVSTIQADLSLNVRKDPMTYRQAIPLAALLTASLCYAQTPTHEEEVVRSAYAAISFLCTVAPVSKAGQDQLTKKVVDAWALDKEIADAVPTFQVSNFQMGTVASIAQRKWGDFVTLPTVGGEVLRFKSKTHSYTDNGNNTGWKTLQAKWDTTSQTVTDDAAVQVIGTTVQGAITQASSQWYDGAVAYDRFASFTVIARLGGRTGAPYKAMFLFGRDSNGKELVVPADMLIEGSALWKVLNFSYYPDALLQSKLRETPVVSAWVQTHTGGECNATRADLCCKGDRCDLPRDAVARDLSRPLPLPPSLSR